MVSQPEEKDGVCLRLLSPGQVDFHLLPFDIVGPLLQQRCFDDGLQGSQWYLLSRQNDHHGHVLPLIGHLQHLVHPASFL